MIEADRPIAEGSDWLAAEQVDIAKMIAGYAINVPTNNGRAVEVTYNLRDMLMDDLARNYKVGDFINDRLEAINFAQARNRVGGVGEGINGALLAASVAQELPSFVMTLPKPSLLAKNRIKGSELHEGDRLLLITDIARAGNILFDSVSFLQSLGIRDFEIVGVCALIDTTEQQTARVMSRLGVPYQAIFEASEIQQYQI